MGMEIRLRSIVGLLSQAKTPESERRIEEGKSAIIQRNPFLLIVDSCGSCPRSRRESAR